MFRSKRVAGHFDLQTVETTVPISNSTQDHEKLNWDTDSFSPCPKLRPGCPDLELEPQRELQLPCGICSERLPEGRIDLRARSAIPRRRIDRIELRVIEGVIGFKAERHNALFAAQVEVANQ